jgi:hypothetical protein
VTRLVPTKTEPRCETCRLEPALRTAVEGFIGRLGEDSELGTLTWEVVRERAWPAITGGPAPSLTSIKRHVRLHTRALDPEAAETGAEESAEVAGATGPQAERLLREVRALLNGGQLVSPQGVLSLQLRAWLLSLQRKLERGEDVTLTPDQAQRAATQLIQAERTAGEADLLQLVARGLSQTFQSALSAPTTAGELEPWVIIVDEEDVVAEDGDDG